MYEFSHPVDEIAAKTNESVRTLQRWRASDDRQFHCALVEKAYSRLISDKVHSTILGLNIPLKEYSSKALGFDNPFNTHIPIAPTSLRQWVKDENSHRVKIMLLGYQTLMLEAAAKTILGRGGVQELLMMVLPLGIDSSDFMRSYTQNKEMLVKLMKEIKRLRDM